MSRSVDYSVFLRHQTGLLMGLGTRAAAGTLTMAMGVTWLLSGGGGSGERLWWWMGLLGALSAMRVLAVHRYLTQGHERSRAWVAVFCVGTLLSALMWGISTWWLGRPATYEHNLILVLVLVGIATGAVVVVSPMLWLFRSYLALLILPMVLDFALRDDSAYKPIAAMAAIGALLLQSIAQNYRKALFEGWTLARTNTKLNEELQESNKALRASNALMQEEMEGRQRMEARFRHAFVQSSIGMSFTDGTVLSEVNLALANVLGFAREDLNGRTLSGLLSVDLDPLERMAAMRDLAVGMMREYPFDAADGQRRWLNVSFARLDEDGDPQAQIAQFVDVTGAREMSSRLLYQARHDELTGLYNRREFEERLEAALQRARDQGVPHAVCYFDLDQFKVVNDTCGHAAGDQLLRQIAATLGTVARKTDTIARMGGDEFVLLMEYCTVEQAQRTAQAVRKALEDITFSWGEKRFRVSASIGLVPVSSGLEKVADLLSAADAACFVAKEQGRNRVHTYGPSDQELATRQSEMAWVERINRAIDDDRLELFYQPIEATVPGGRKERHIELLLRLREEDGRLVPPGAFLPPAERYHIITRIDRWVVERILRSFEEEPALAAQVDVCGINLSGQSLTNEEFFEFLRDAMRRLGPRASRICFEITETAAIANIGAAENFIRELRALGCKFSLDDFGSGLSSFGYLKQLPVDHLKIDGVFIRDLLSDPVDYALVRAINEVGKTLGKTTIAEFVENDQIRAKLAELGVDCVQGYGVGRPRPLREILATAAD